MQITANAKIAVQVANAVANFKTADKAGRQGTFFDASKADVKAKYEGTSFAPAAQRVLDITARADTDSSFKKGNNNNQVSMAKGQAFEAQVQFIMASGVMNPAQIEAMLKIFEGDLNSMDIALNVGIRKLGGARLGELELLLGGTNKETAKKITLALIRKDPAEFDKTAKALALLAASDGYEVNMSAYLKTVGILGLEQLTNKLTAIENIKDPITKTLDLQNTGLTADQLAQLTADWAYYMSLDPVTRKEAIQTFTMINDVVANFKDDDARRIWAQKYASQEALMAGDVGSKAYTTTYNEIYKIAFQGDKELLSSLLTQKKYGTPLPVVVQKAPPPAVVPSGKKDNPLSFLDDLAMRLKQVRDNSFNALTPVKSLLAAFTSKKAKKDASRMFDIFDGIQNKLLAMGVSKDFRDAINSMSAQDFEKIAKLKGKDALFTFDGKGKTKDNITGLTQTGKAVDAGYNEKNLGDYQLVNEETIKNIQNQDIAYKKLIASGMSASDALGVVAVEGQAAAIAAGAISTSDPSWKTYIERIKTANSALEKQTLLNKLIKSNEEFKIYQKMPELVTKMKDMGYSMDQIDTVLGDPELGKQLSKDLEDGKLDAKEIAEYLNSIEAKKVIDIQIAINKGDWQKVAAEGRALVDEMFRVREELIRTGSQAQQVEKNKGQIADYEAQLLPFRRQIQLINQEIADAQRAIEMNYGRPIEKLTEEVNDLNRELEMNPFFGDRAIKKIQDENNMLSNDLTVIAHAADEVNKRYDEQAEALSKVQEINANIMDQQKQQIGLADALTQGDISAAALAAQGMRESSAAQFASGQSDALDQARKNALGAITGPQSGLTQEQINEKMYQNSQKIYAMETDPRRLEILNQIQVKQDEIYNLEEKREDALIRIRDLEDKIYKIEQESIRPIQEKIDKLVYQNTLLEAEIEKEIRSLEVLDKTRTEWNRINAELDLSAIKSKNLETAFGNLLTAAAAITGQWEATLDLINKVIAAAGKVPAGSGTGKTGTGTGTGGTGTGGTGTGTGTGGTGTGGTGTGGKALKQGDAATKASKIANDQAILAQSREADAAYDQTFIDKIMALGIPSPKDNKYGNYGDEGLTLEQRKKLREAGLDDDFRRIANKTSVAARETDRAATHPLLDFSKRPDARSLEDENFFYFYSWVGSSWNLYRASKTPENIDKYGSRSFGGDTQGVGGDKRGANALTVQPQPIKDAKGNIIGYEIPDYDTSSTSELPDPTLYNAPKDDAESIQAFDEFISIVKKVDAAQEALDAAEGSASTEEYNRLVKQLADAQAAYDETLPEVDPTNLGGGSGSGGRYGMQYAASGGLIKPRYFTVGGNVRGTDSVPAMLTPGEFVMSKYAVQAHGAETMKAINNGNSVGDAVYNYSISVNVASNSNPDEIARAVMGQVRSIESQRLRGTRI
jgi:hypothetical protein